MAMEVLEVELIISHFTGLATNKKVKPFVQQQEWQQWGWKQGRVVLKNRLEVERNTFELLLGGDQDGENHQPREKQYRHHVFLNSII